MSEKRFKVRIKNGNVEVETISGFSGNECHSTVEAVVGVMGLAPSGSCDKAPEHDLPGVFISTMG